MVSRKKWIFRVTLADAGERLDRFLHGKLPEISRSQLKNIIQEGYVSLVAGEAKPARILKSEDRITVNLPPAKADRALPEDLPLDILYEDSDILVLNKAADMVTHPGSGRRSGTLVNALLHHCRDLSGVGGVLRPGIVHRLDKGTSGVLVIAKNDLAHHSLSAQFQDRSIRKTYLAFVWGTPRDQNGWILLSLGRSRSDRKKMSSRTVKGREAVTHYRVLKSWGPVSLLELEPKTGRTHQLRVHLSELGHPVLGDPDYGKGLRKLGVLPPELKNWVEKRPFQLLHASSLSLVHPRTQKSKTFTAPPREEMQELEVLLKKSFP